MKTIQPTPSQAAVVLKNFLRAQGVELKLGQTQEAIARIYGYADWNTLTADIPARGKLAQTAAQPLPAVAATFVGQCKRCGSLLFRGYCSSDSCDFHHWPQRVDGSSPGRLSDDSIEQYYGIYKRRGDDELYEPPLNYFATLSEEHAEAVAGTKGPEDERLDELFRCLEGALLDTGLLTAWRRQNGRDERASEQGTPYLQVSFDKRLSDRFVTELVFTLREHQLQCYVRTWELRDGIDHSRDYGIFDERSGDFDSNAELPDEWDPLSALVATAVAEADLHKTRLMQRVNVS